MFRNADLGRVWVPVVLPLGDFEGDVSVKLLLQLYTRDELRERERSVLTRTASGIVDRAKQVTTPEELQVLFDEVTRVEAADVQELLDRTHDWRDVTDEHGQAQSFSRDRLAALLSFNWWFQAHRGALFEASRAGVAKNWKPGPGGLPVRAQA